MTPPVTHAASAAGARPAPPAGQSQRPTYSLRSGTGTAASAQEPPARGQASAGALARAPFPAHSNTLTMPSGVHVLVGAPARAFLAGPYADLYRADAAATAYQCPGWLNAWADQLPAAGDPLCLVALGPSGHPVAALPLVSDNTGPRRRLYPLAAPVSDYVRATGPQADTPHVAEALALGLAQLAHDGADVEISDIPAASGLGQALARTAAHEGWQQSTWQCAAIRLPVDYTAMPASTRRDHRRRQRRWNDLSTTHSVEYRRTTTTAELRAAASILADLHQRRWADRPFQPGAAHPVAASDLDTLLSRCGAAHAFIATLTVDHTVVAAQLCLYHRSTCYSLLPAMDPNHRDLAPGHALLRHLIRDVHDHGFQILDLGRTAEGQHAYKEQYRPRWTTTLTTAVQPDLAAA
jgi:CelD/BcsL family acetyltransferase involved in cellulose biosynthesis